MYIMSLNAKISNTCLPLISFVFKNWQRFELPHIQCVGLDIGNWKYRLHIHIKACKTNLYCKTIYFFRGEYFGIIMSHHHYLSHLIRGKYKEASSLPNLIASILVWGASKTKMLKKNLSVRVVSPNKIALTLLYKKLRFWQKYLWIFFRTNWKQDERKKNKYFSGVYTVVECSCHVSLAASIFLTVALSIERFQVCSFALLFFCAFVFFALVFLCVFVCLISCFLSLAASIFLTVALSIERFQVCSFALVFFCAFVFCSCVHLCFFCLFAVAFLCAFCLFALVFLCVFCFFCTCILMCLFVCISYLTSWLLLPPTRSSRFVFFFL